MKDQNEEASAELLHFCAEGQEQQLKCGNTDTGVWSATNLPKTDTTEM